MPSSVSTQPALGRLPQEGFVRLPVVLSVYPVSKAYWWEGVRAGRLPLGIKLSPRVTVWDVASIRALIANNQPKA